MFETIDFPKLLICVAILGGGAYLYFDWAKRTEQYELAAHQREQVETREREERRLASEKLILEEKAKAEAASLALKAKYEKEHVENLRLLELEKVKTLEAQRAFEADQERVKATRTEAEKVSVSKEESAVKLVDQQRVAKSVDDLRTKLAATNKSIEEARERAAEARKKYVMATNEADTVKAQITRADSEITELVRLSGSGGDATRSSLRYDVQAEIQKKSAGRAALIDKHRALCTQATTRGREQKKANDDADGLVLVAKRLEESIKQVVETNGGR